MRRQLPADGRKQRLHHLSDLHKSSINFGRSRAASGSSGLSRWRCDQLVARRAAVLDQLRSARRRATKTCVRSRRCPARRRRRPSGAGVRVLRWGPMDGPGHQLVPSPVAGPTWYNQDGAIRTGVAIGANVTQNPTDFRQFSLAMFTGLLAMTFRILIWFDHIALGRDPGQSVVSRRRPRR
jgi:hypothetical protein